jgi:RNA polymerase sigma factor (sigma-70 family)
MRDFVDALHAESLATLDQFNQRTVTAFEAVERLRLGGAQLSQGSLLRDQRILSRTAIEHRAQMVTSGSMTLDELPTAIAEVVRHRLTGIEADLTPILERFVYGNLRLVHAVARGFAVNEGGREELIGVGNLTLLRCAREFNPGLGFRFSTYAFPSIKHAMGDALANLRRGDAPKAPDGEKRRVVSYSLETPVKHRDDNQTLREVIPDPKAESPRDAVMRSDEDQVSRRLVHRALDSLPPEERTIVKRFFGLSGGERTSIADIAVELELSREQVRQRLARATRLMRVSLIDASAPALTALGLID